MSRRPRYRSRTLQALAVSSTLLMLIASPAIASPSAAEQQLIYELNMARWDPIGFRARTGITIPAWVLPRSPLAVNNQLSSSARTTALCTPPPGQAHYCNGTYPNKRVRDAGYPLPSYWSNSGNQVESTYGGGTAPLNALQGWFNSANPSHLDHTMGQSEFFGTHREVGAGHNGSGRWILHTAHRDDPTEQVFVTGVAFADANDDTWMTLGEGRSGVNMELRTGGTVHDQDTTNVGGGYSLLVPGPGTYTVRASGIDFSNQDITVTVGVNNVGVDFVVGSAPVVRDFGQGTRLAGSNRYATAVAVTKKYFPNPALVDTVFVATGEDFPDALAGAAIAGKLEAPLLLTASSYLPTETRNEILRLGPSSIVILGGGAVINGAVENQLNSIAPVTRLYGADRYETAVSASKYGFPANDSADVVFIATGTGFADALTSASAAVERNGPVLLTLPGSLPQSTRDEILRLLPNQVIILGGTAAVSTAVENQLKGLISNTIRVQGADRYATAVAISKHAYPGSSPNVPAVFVTIGTDFPDALAGAAVAAAIGAPVILSPPGSMHTAVASEITRLGPTQDTLIVLGGTHVFSVGLHHAFLNLIG